MTTNIHNLSDADFAAFEADMFGGADVTFDAWVASHEALVGLDGWRELQVWIDDKNSGRRSVRVNLDGVQLYSAVYYLALGVWHEVDYSDGEGREAWADEEYMTMGYMPYDGWRWNEFTDEWDVPEWAIS